MSDAGARLALGKAEPLPFAHEDVARSLLERFARVAATWPSAVAIGWGSDRITYRELACRSDALAAAITADAPSSEAPVAILLSDPVRMITSMLATWKAGRLCVPLDSTLPSARLEVVLRDSEAGLIVTDRDKSAPRPLLPGVSSRQLLFEAVDLLAAVEPPRVTVTPDTPACLLYTSGSTGEPKGVPKTHRNMLDRFRCSIASLGIGPEDRISGLHSPAFLAGVRDIVNALLSGATLLPFDLRRAGLAPVS
jgi:non-ribosomal peptide synthetase component F